MRGYTQNNTVLALIAIRIRRSTDR